MAYLANMPLNMFGTIDPSSLEEISTMHKDNLIDSVNSATMLCDAAISLVDGRVRATILVTQSNIENLNSRQYTAGSLQRAVDDAQEDVRLGLIIGYETHPEPVFNEQMDPVGYNYTQNPPLFRVTKLWYSGGQVWAEAEFFDSPKGIEYSNRIRSGQKVSVSLRALGE